MRISVLPELSSRLTKDFGKGFSVRTLQHEIKAERKRIEEQTSYREKKK